MSLDDYDINSIDNVIGNMHDVSLLLDEFEEETELDKLQSYYRISGDYDE